MKIPRNEPCPCLSGKKYKKCCSLQEKPVAFQLTDELQVNLENSKIKQVAVTPELNQQCNDVLTHLEQDDLAKAQELAAGLYAANPHNDYVNFVQGACAVKAGEYAQAINYFEQAIKAYPLFAEAYYNLGHAYFMQDEIASAIVCLRKVLEIERMDSQNPELSNSAQQMLASLETSIKAEHNCNLDGFIKFVELVNRAETCFAAAQYRKAIMLFGQALELSANNAQIYEKMAVAYNSLGQKDAAMACITKVMSLDPSYMERFAEFLAQDYQEEDQELVENQEQAQL